MVENNEIRIGNIRSLKVNIFSGGKELKLTTRVSFECDTPDNLYVLLKMSKQKLPLNVVILSPQKDLPLGVLNENT